MKDICVSHSFGIGIEQFKFALSLDVVASLARWDEIENGECKNGVVEFAPVMIQLGPNRLTLFAGYSGYKETITIWIDFTPEHGDKSGDSLFRGKSPISKYVFQQRIWSIVIRPERALICRRLVDGDLVYRIDEQLSQPLPVVMVALFLRQGGPKTPLK